MTQAINQIPPARPQKPLRQVVRQKLGVMHAVILRDIRSRFFNHGLGFLVVPLFPVGHVAILIAIYTLVGRNAPFGQDLKLFFATGLMPVLLFVYVSRFMSLSLMANKSMMAFPVVRALDIVLARAGLEFIGIVLSILIVTVILVSAGTNPYPVAPATALSGLLVVSVLAIGVGIIASVISAIYPFFAFVYALVIILLYLLSGAPIYLHIFPEKIVYILSWNPLFHAVDWIRSAYYLGHPVQVLDKVYLVGWALGSLAVGLAMERLFRAKILES